MNREAAALGTPVYTTYGGRLGGVDEALIRSGRLRPLTDPRALRAARSATAEASADQARPRPLWSRPSSVRSVPHHRAPSHIRNDLLDELAERRVQLDDWIALAAEGEPRPVDAVLRALDIVISASCCSCSRRCWR